MYNIKLDINLQCVIFNNKDFKIKLNSHRATEINISTRNCEIIRRKHIIYEILFIYFRMYAQEMASILHI